MVVGEIIFEDCSTGDSLNEVVIAADVSATNLTMGMFIDDNCNFSVGRVLQVRYPGQEVRDFRREVLDDFLLKAKKIGILNSRDGKVNSMVLSPAGPISSDGKTATVTNSGFSLDTDKYGIPTVLINDFAAIAYGVVAHQEGSLLENMIELYHGDIKDDNYGKPVERGRIGILGAGTGFGTSRLIFNRDKEVYEIFDSEGGHRFFPIDASSNVEIEFLRYVNNKRGDGTMVIFDDVLSGGGIEKLAEFFHTRSYWIDGRDNRSSVRKSLSEMRQSEDIPAYVAGMAKENPNSAFSKAMNLFWEFYGRAIHDLAVHDISKGGIYVAGGIIMKNMGDDNDEGIDHNINERLMTGYDNGPTHRDWVNNIPVSVIMDANVGLKGAHYVVSNPGVFEKENYKGIASVSQ
jgi:glucokinase